MEVYHLGSTKFARQLTGEGAKLHGGRWNTIGQPCLYTSETQALSILEYAANIPLDQMPADLSITIYSIPHDSWRQFTPDELPKNWMDIPVAAQTRQWGTERLQKQEFLALKLPSVIIPSEFNYILNPLHPDFKKVRIKDIVPFNFDSRIKQ
jgi:RES domain-containing protein